MKWLRILLHFICFCADECSSRTLGLSDDGPADPSLSAAELKLHSSVERKMRDRGTTADELKASKHPERSPTSHHTKVVK